MFEAVPLKDAIEGLMGLRDERSCELRKGIKKLLQGFGDYNKGTAATSEEQQFVIFPIGKGGVLRRKKAKESAQETIDCVNSWKRFPKTLLTYAEETKKALQRGVKFRLILEKPRDVKSIAEEILEFQETGDFRIRYIPNPPPAIISIYDKKEVLVATLSSTGLEQSPTLWTNNPSMIVVIQDYFEIMWITAIEEPLRIEKMLKAPLNLNRITPGGL